MRLHVISLAFVAPMRVASCPSLVFAEIPETTSARAVYLEITETNSDTFPKAMVRPKQCPRAYPFVYEEGTLIIDEEVLSLTPERIEEIQILLKQNIDIQKGRKGIVYIVNFVQFVGKGRIYSREEYYAGATKGETTMTVDWVKIEELD